MKNLQKFYNEVEKFNEIGESFKCDLRDAANLYLSLTFEENSEGIYAFERDDPVELLDAAVDTLITSIGLIQALEKAGFNVEEAMKRIAANNLAKFPNVADGCQHLDEYTAEVNDKYNVYVIKDNNGKIRKPEGFSKVDLTDLVPSNWFDGYGGAV